MLEQFIEKKPANHWSPTFTVCGSAKRSDLSDVPRGRLLVAKFTFWVFSALTFRIVSLSLEQVQVACSACLLVGYALVAVLKWARFSAGFNTLSAVLRASSLDFLLVDKIRKYFENGSERKGSSYPSENSIHVILQNICHQVKRVFDHISTKSGLRFLFYESFLTFSTCPTRIVRLPEIYERLVAKKNFWQ